MKRKQQRGGEEQKGEERGADNTSVAGKMMGMGWDENRCGMLELIDFFNCWSF